MAQRDGLDAAAAPPRKRRRDDPVDDDVAAAAKATSRSRDSLAKATSRRRDSLAKAARDPGDRPPPRRRDAAAAAAARGPVVDDHGLSRPGTWVPFPPPLFFVLPSFSSASPPTYLKEN